MQPDTLIPSPSNPQSWNRYSYVFNRPINFNDPSGHCGDPISGTACLALLPTGPVGWVGIGILLLGSLAVGVAAGNAVADAREKWREHDPHAKDREAMEDNYGATGDSFIIWRGKPDKNNKPKCGLVCKLLLGGSLGGVMCVSMFDENCTNAVLGPNPETLPTPTLTLTPSVTVTSTSTSTPTVTPTLTVTSTSTPTQTSKPTQTPTPPIFTPTPPHPGGPAIPI